MTDRHDLFRRLREALADCYPDRTRAELLAYDIGLNLAEIDLSGAPVVFWQRVLDEAERKGKVEMVLVWAFTQAPARSEFADLRTEYLQWKKAGPPAPVAPRPPAVPAIPQEPLGEWDVFISHAWEDKEAIARPLAKALAAKGLRVWFDEFTLSVGDRLRRSIDKGLASCRYGIVILSPTFFAKEWPQKELDGLVQRENKGQKVILPVWHNVGAEQITSYSPSLADRIGVRSDVGLDRTVAELLRAMGRPAAIPSVHGPSGDLWVLESPVRMEFVRIPAGEFLMGSDPQTDRDPYQNEQPQHRLDLPEYYVGKYPVTVTQYAVFALATGRQLGEAQGRADHPVTEVTWHDAVAFCDWLSTETGRTLRLPTEAEWEKAARGRDGRIYPWGNQPPDGSLCNFNTHVGDTTPVGQYPAGASPYGVLDMAGNVWEWTASLDRPYPYREDDGRNDAEATGYRVLRGGSWLDLQWCARCACRLRYGPGAFLDNVGLRVFVAS